MSGISQFMTTSQFYLYGRWHCTRTGWENAVKSYMSPDILKDENLSLANKVYMITGANAGIGKEITSFLVSKGAIVYMICRSPERARKAQEEIIEKTGNHNCHVLIGDCGLEKDVRRVWQEFVTHQRQNYQLPADDGDAASVRLDCLICNAGALLNHKTFTSEGVEVTFATHLLFGTYLLGSLAIPYLQKNTGGRLIVVSSGGMYNTKFPSWEIATSTGLQPYDGQFAYAYAKRGQILLCEEWAKAYPDLTVVSCHPGWVKTEGVDSAYGEKQSWLEPLRTPWEGAEAIVWLAVCRREWLSSGEFYLDRSTQPKHLAGPFMTEGSATKNTKEEVQEMMINLERWSSAAHRPSLEQVEGELLKQRPLTASTRPIDLSHYMGDWYVLGNIPTPLEVGVSNGIERYRYDEKNRQIKVTFDYHAKTTATTGSSMKMRATVFNDPVNTHWKLDPKVLGVPIPLGLDYLLLDFSEEEGYAVVGVPDRSYLWIMTREIPSEFDQTNVPINDVYFPSTAATASAKAEKGEEGKEGGRAAVGEKEEGEDKTVNETNEKQKRERAILRKTLALVDRYGYDLKKIIRVPWISSLTAKK